MNRCSKNILNGETEEEMICLSGLINFDKEDFEHGICSDLIGVVDLEL